MAASSGVMSAGDGSDGGHELAEEFRCVIRVDDIHLESRGGNGVRRAGEVRG
jgi:hypothetical protein